MDSIRYSFPDNYKVEHFSHALGKLGVPFMIDPKRNRTDVIIIGDKKSRLDILFLANAHGCISRDPLIFLIDINGLLWKGPTNPDDNMQWAFFRGYMDAVPYDPIWVPCQTGAPQKAMEVSLEFALEFALLSWDKAAGSRPDAIVKSKTRGRK